MSQNIPAVFDAGVFRPLVPVELAQGTRVEVELPPTMEVGAAPYSAAAMRAFLEKMKSMPDDSPRDGFSNQDHDRLIYGV